MAFESSVVVFVPDVPQLDVGVVTATCHPVVIVRKNPKTVH